MADNLHSIAREELTHKQKGNTRKLQASARYLFFSRTSDSSDTQAGYVCTVYLPPLRLILLCPHRLRFRQRPLRRSLSVTQEVLHPLRLSLLSFVPLPDTLPVSLASATKRLRSHHSFTTAVQ